MAETTYNVGIYCRLSNDDERAGESLSIANQKLLLQQYVRDQGWKEIDTYIDDGYSGTNFDRPGVQRLIADAQAKRINLILVKDLSRFGRNYIEFGRYIDYVFPAIGCRFIALNNGVDTANNDSSMDSMCFLNLFNEFYSRDTSKKVKAVKKACAEQGKFMGTHPPLGYKRDPADKHHFLIDEDTAPIPADESTSIENQKELLSKFVMLNGWVETKTYVDDGYSGGNFQRPGFLEMLEDARNGVINLILVKDLSRLGRDYVEVGRYTDFVFPSLGCRFVSVLDCLDSEGDNTDMLHFRSLMNDYHLRDLSSKIKSVLLAK